MPKALIVYSTGSRKIKDIVELIRRRDKDSPELLARNREKIDVIK